MTEKDVSPIAMATFVFENGFQLSFNLILLVKGHNEPNFFH